MKIAIQGHPTRGKEVIQILESLGGVNRCPLTGESPHSYYYIDYKHNDAIYCHDVDYVNKYCEKYTLEEFEKEFPFKIGDKIKYISSIGIIKEYCYINNEPAYKVESTELGIIVTMPAKELNPYKEMERNITLTLDKAKEWYKKGGELKEIALQAFTEKELNPLPTSWEEFCIQGNPIAPWRYGIPTKYEALYKLEKLRDCWWNGWKPEWDFGAKYAIKNSEDELCIILTYNIAEFLAFPTKEMAEEFYKCFKDLIEKAGDLI